ncbi:hypothetical protein JW823_07195 [bacterium]|nr:hypothetical protein [candidate division CSSED10-310 bacterium]
MYKKGFSISIIVMLITIMSIPQKAASDADRWYLFEDAGPNQVHTVVRVPDTDDSYAFTDRGDLWFCNGDDCLRINIQKYPEFWFSPTNFHGYFDQEIDELGALTFDIDGICHFWVFHGDWMDLGETNPGPLRLEGSAWAWDPVRHRGVLFGGRFFGDYKVDQTWEWDGAGWYQVMPEHSPGPQSGGCMVYDATNHRMIMTAKKEGLIEFWSWDGTDWAFLSEPSGHVAWKDFKGFACNGSTGEMALFGGLGYFFLDTFHYWNGHEWSLLDIPGGPMPRAAANVYFDTTGLLTLTGGYIDLQDELGHWSTTSFSDKWTTDFTTWTQVRNQPMMACSYQGYAAAFDRTSGTGLLVTRLVDRVLTYQWNTDRWFQLFPDQSPLGIGDFMMVPQRHDQSYLIMGSLAGENFQWTFRDNTWNLNDPVTRPSYRELFPIAYHDNLQQTLLYGGREGMFHDPDQGFYYTISYDEMWGWDGTEWHLIDMPDPKPPKLFRHVMAYDWNRERLVIAGGKVGIDHVNVKDLEWNRNVWEWDGSEWFAIPVPEGEGPADYDLFDLFYHAGRGTMFQICQDGSTWEWDGISWTRISWSVGFDTLAQTASVAFYDSAEDRAVTQDNFFNRTYAFDDEPAGSPCKKTGVTLELSHSMVHPGDTFYCNAVICNQSAIDVHYCPLFVLLDVFGQYFFGPGWTTEYDNYLTTLPIIPGGFTEVEIIPAFQWPDNCGSAEGIRFIAAITDPLVRGIIGEYSIAEFGWSEGTPE